MLKSKSLETIKINITKKHVNNFIHEQNLIVIKRSDPHSVMDESPIEFRNEPIINCIII